MSSCGQALGSGVGDPERAVGRGHLPPMLQRLKLGWCHFETMPDYGAKVGTPIHTGFFQISTNHLPAVLFQPFSLWSGIAELAP